MVYTINDGTGRLEAWNWKMGEGEDNVDMQNTAW